MADIHSLNSIPLCSFTCEVFTLTNSRAAFQSTAHTTVMSALKIFRVFSLLTLTLHSSATSTNPADPGRTELQVVLQQPLTTPGPNVVATMVHLTMPPGDIGSLPHTHPGPVVGYVLEGEFLLQVSFRRIVFTFTFNLCGD